jgi:hypothetical protein
MRIELPSHELTEAQLRESKVPSPKAPEDLSAYIGALVDRPHDYGTAVYAMSMAAVAAFNYAASKLGVSGFQASCADMDIIRRTRSMRGPFILIDGANALYPQYDLQGKLADFLTEIQPWLATEAAKVLESFPAEGAAAVRQHLEALAAEARP